MSVIEDVLLGTSTGGENDNDLDVVKLAIPLSTLNLPPTKGEEESTKDGTTTF